MGFSDANSCAIARAETGSGATIRIASKAPRTAKVSGDLYEANVSWPSARSGDASGAALADVATIAADPASPDEEEADGIGLSV